MRNKLLILFLLPLFLALQPLAQGTVKDFLGAPTTFDSVNDSVIATGNGHGTVGFQISGTWTGVISFTGTINGTDWVTVKGWDSENALAITEADANGIFFFATTGLRYVKAKITTYTTGPATIQTITTDDVTVMSSISASGGGGGGAEGSVDVLSIAAGNNNIGNVDVVTLPNVTVSTFPDNEPFNVAQWAGSTATAGAGAVAAGTPRTTLASDDPAVAALQVIDDWDESDRAKVNPISGQVGVQGGSGTVSNTTQRVVLATDVALPAGTNAIGKLSPNSGVDIGDVDVTSSALPSGAATSAKQPALGTAGSPSLDVLTVQGSGSGTALPVSAASLPLPTLAATSTKQSDGSQKTQIVDGSGNVVSTTSNNLNVQCANCSGSGASATDKASFTSGSSTFAPSGLFYQTTSTSNPLVNGQQGMAQGTIYRAMHVNLRDASGNEVSVGGGTQYDDDAAYAGDGAKVTMAGVVRRDANTTLAASDGDVAPLQVNAAGALKVDASGAAIPITDNSGSLTVDYATTGSGTATGALRVELPTNGTGVIATVGTITTLPNITLAAGTNTNEVVGDAAHDATAAGNPLLEGGYASAAAPSDVSADGDVVRGWRLRNGSAATTLTAAGALIGGDATNGLDADVTRAFGQAAHDAAIAGAPFRIGLRAVTADYTAVATGDQADAIGTIDGKQITKPHAIRASTWTYAAASGGITNTTAATMKTAAAAGIRNCLTSIQVINGHATVSTEVLVRDGAAGTVLHRGFAQAAGGGYAANFDVPICGTAATLMEVVPVTTGSAIYVNAQGYISAE